MARYRSAEIRGEKQPVRFAIGPGTLVTAAFIGPGTITTASVAGASFGYALAWGLVVATFAAIILQDLAARLAIVSDKGVGRLLGEALPKGVLRFVIIGVAIVALYGGNAAYEAGNLVGGALGIGLLVKDVEVPRLVTVLIPTTIASFAVMSPNYRTIERRLLVIVALMATAFLVTAIIILFRTPETPPAPLWPLRIPNGGASIALALVGTTVVPYNLFLHGAAARERWHGGGDTGSVDQMLRASRIDTVVAIGLGGLVSLAILFLAARLSFSTSIYGPADMARALAPLFGIAAQGIFAFGLMTAGVTSAVTAPLATAYAFGEFTGRKAPFGSREFRTVALSVVWIGAFFALFGGTPIGIILTAQLANGFLLPFAAIGLMALGMSRAIMGRHRLTGFHLILVAIVVLVALTLGGRLIMRTFGAL
ncbi:MAG: divalent metal cation transporter [Pseudomonadota bacterium]